MTQVNISTAADYADAMMTARRAKNWLFLILLLMLLGQLTLFFVARYTDIVVDSNAPVTTAPVWPESDVVQSSVGRNRLHYALSLTSFLGATVPVVLTVVLLLIVTIMLVGRLVGVAKVTSAFIWCVVLVVFLFPWQSFLDNVYLTPDRAEFKVPGALYTWAELSHPTLGAKFSLNVVGDSSNSLPRAILKWARFVAFPVAALLILLAIQVKSNRGLKQALGESPVEGDDLGGSV
ncbi:MAG: hypothetical protein ACREIT_01275 [Tepidisphaeraceae bacterium]